MMKKTTEIKKGSKPYIPPTVSKLSDTIMPAGTQCSGGSEYSDWCACGSNPMCATDCCDGSAAPATG